MMTGSGSTMVHCRLSTREANIGRDERRIFVSTTRIVNPGTTRRLDTLDSRAACRRREGRDREICDVASRLCRYRRRACDRVRQDRRTKRYQSNHVLSVPSRHRYRPHRHRLPARSRKGGQDIHALYLFPPPCSLKHCRYRRCRLRCKKRLKSVS